MTSGHVSHWPEDYRAQSSILGLIQVFSPPITLPQRFRFKLREKKLPPALKFPNSLCWGSRNNTQKPSATGLKINNTHTSSNFCSCRNFTLLPCISLMVGSRRMMATEKRAYLTVYSTDKRKQTKNRKCGTLCHARLTKSTAFTALFLSVVTISCALRLPIPPHERCTQAFKPDNNAF